MTALPSLRFRGRHAKNCDLWCSLALQLLLLLLAEAPRVHRGLLPEAEDLLHEAGAAAAAAASAAKGGKSRVTDMNNLVDVSLVPALHEHVLILPAGEKEVGAVRPVGVHGGVPPDAADAPRAAHAAGAANAAHVVHAATVVELALAHGVLAGPGLAPAAAAAL